MGFVAGFGEAFATRAFLGVGFWIGFGVVLALNAGVALGFAGVAVAVGFGVTVGNSISLFAVVAKQVSQVDPPPEGLIKGDQYDVKINFELNTEEKPEN